MAAPALQKTWQGGSTPGGTELVNVVVTGVGTKAALWALKNALVSFNSNPWTVIGSSDGAGSNMVGTDLWVDSGDILYPTNPGDPFSWIVLQQTGIGATYQIMLSYVQDLAADPQRENFSFQLNAGGYGISNGGSTDGSTTVLPDVADSNKTNWINGNDWIGAENGSDTQKVMTCISSTDGECFRAIVSQQSTGIPITGIGIEVPRLPPAGWSENAMIYIFKSTVASGLSCFRWETMQVAEGIRALLPKPSGGFLRGDLRPQGPMFSTVEVIDLQEDDRPNPMLYPMTIYGGAYADDSDLTHGTFFDWYWCSRNAAGKHLLDLDTIPLAGDRTFVCLGDNVIGWLDDSATDLSYT